MSFHAAVVEDVVLSRLQIAEQPEQILRSADSEPEGGDDADESRHQQILEEEIVPPPLQRPGGEFIPYHHRQKTESEGVAEGVEEDRPGENFIPAAVLAVDAENLQQEKLPDRPERTLFDYFAGITVDSAMKHPIHVERLPAGEKRDHDIQQYRRHDGEKADFSRVDRELVRIHRPDDVGVERRREVVEDFSYRIDQIQPLQQRIEMGGPELLGQNSGKCNDGSADERRIGSGGGAAFPVQPERDHHARAGPDGSGDGKKHENVVDLSEKQTEEEGEETDPGDGVTQGPDLFRRRECLPAERYEEVLHQNAAPGVHISGVGGDHEKDHECAEDSRDAHGENVPDGDRNEHLAVDRAE